MRLCVCCAGVCCPAARKKTSPTCTTDAPHALWRALSVECRTCPASNRKLQTHLPPPTLPFTRTAWFHRSLPPCRYSSGSARVPVEGRVGLRKCVGRRLRVVVFVRTCTVSTSCGAFECIVTVLCVCSLPMRACACSISSFHYVCCLYCHISYVTSVVCSTALHPLQTVRFSPPPPASQPLPSASSTSTDSRASCDSPVIAVGNSDIVMLKAVTMAVPWVGGALVIG